MDRQITRYGTAKESTVVMSGNLSAPIWAPDSAVERNSPPRAPPAGNRPDQWWLAV
jgi:hypothetical protein